VDDPASTAAPTDPRDDAESAPSLDPVSEPLRIAVVVYGDLDSISGGFRYDREVISRLRARGDTVDVISLPWRWYGRGLVDAFDPRIRKQLDRDVDVLVEDGLCHPSVWRHNAELSGPDAIVGLVHHVRSDGPTERYTPLMRPFERQFFRSVDATIATSSFTHDRVERIAPSTTRGPTVVAPPAGRTEGAATTADRVRERADDGPLRVVFVGNVVPRKNLETVVDALVRLDGRAGWPEPRLTVIGDLDASPEYADRIVDRVAALELDDRIEFTDTLSAAELESTVGRCHVCCVPARYEAFGMVHLEAMEHGVVPIAGTMGGTSEFLRHGENGYLVDPDDDEALADRLESLAADRERLAEMGVEALHTAETHPTWAETTDEIRGFLRSVVDGNAPGARDPNGRGERP